MSKTILVVDDEERIVSLLKAYLTNEGFRVVTAKNGREALFSARDEKPDLILLDIMMPEMDGHEFIRLHRKERETPIIMLTAKIEDDPCQPRYIETVYGIGYPFKTTRANNGK